MAKRTPKKWGEYSFENYTKAQRRFGALRYQIELNYKKTFEMSRYVAKVSELDTLQPYIKKTSLLDRRAWGATKEQKYQSYLRGIQQLEEFNKTISTEMGKYKLLEKSVDEWVDKYIEDLGGIDNITDEVMESVIERKNDMLKKIRIDKLNWEHQRKAQAFQARQARASKKFAQTGLAHFLTHF